MISCALLLGCSVLSAADPAALAASFPSSGSAGDDPEALSLSRLGLPANGPCERASISHDGCLVAFASDAANLVRGDRNRCTDVFVHDRRAARTWRVSVASDGREGDGRSFSPHVSGDGRWVLFTSYASNLLRDAASAPTAGVYLHDLRCGTTQLVSLDEGGVPYPAALASAPGRGISGDGSVVVFAAIAETYGQVMQVVARDLRAGVTTLLSATPAGSPGNLDSGKAAISRDGATVAFVSSATDLAPGAIEHRSQIFVRRLADAQLRMISRSPAGIAGDSICLDVDIDAHGRRVAFASRSGNLVAGDFNSAFDVFVCDLDD